MLPEELEIDEILTVRIDAEPVPSFQGTGTGVVSGGVHAALNALPVKAGGAVGRAIESKVGGLLGGALTGGTIAAGAGAAAGASAAGASA